MISYQVKTAPPLKQRRTYTIWGEVTMASPHNVRKTLPPSIKKVVKQFMNKLGGTHYWQYALLLAAATMLFGYIRSSIQKNWTAKAIAKVDASLAKYDEDTSSALAVAEATNQFALVIDLDGMGEPRDPKSPVVLRDGNIYEVLVPVSRHTSYYVRPTRCDARMVVVEPFGYTSDYPCSIEDWSRDRNLMVFRRDPGYTTCKFYPCDHQTGLPVVVKFKVVADEKVGQPLWRGRPMTPEEKTRYCGQGR